MKKGRKYTKEEIVTIAKSAIGKTFRELKDKESVTISEKSCNKGDLGQYVERTLYGIENNNKSEPDFMPAGIELKVTPYKKNKDGSLSAKERLVLNIIDYSTEYQKEFRSSHFWFKNSKIELIWYLSEKEKQKLDYTITHEKFLELDCSEDIYQIENDWNTIIQKIKEGKAHEISEADTMYLGACTKGVNKESKKKQPFSNEKAKQRAFCFKTSYMTSLVRKYIGTYKDVEKVLKDTNYSFDAFVNNVIYKYKDKTQAELMKELNVDSKAKNIFSVLINRMFHVKTNLRNTDEFLKANIIPKTVRVEENGKIKESMSLPYFRFDEIVNTSFENSNLKDQLETTKYMFFIFQHTRNGYVFKGIKLWNMPKEMIEKEVKKVYEKTQKIIQSGEIVHHIDSRGRWINNFPKKKDNLVCHVRPHGINAKDTFPLPVADKQMGISEFTKQSFWINNSYLKEIVKEFLD